MTEQLPVGEGYGEEVQFAMSPFIQLDGVSYSDYFGFSSMKDMLHLVQKNATVCDVGCAWAVFAKEAGAIRKDIRIFSVNPGFALSSIRNQKLGARTDLFSAYSPELPFKTGFFDATFDVWAGYHYSYDWRSHLYKLDEMLRITKRGGKLFLGPLPSDDVEEIKTMIERIGRVSKRLEHIYGSMQAVFLTLYV